MRIAFVLTSLGLGGAERQAVAIAERLARRGHTVIFLVLGRRVEQEWPTHLPVYRLDMRKNPVDFLWKVRKARAILEKFKPDLLHAHCFHANLFARLLCRKGVGGAAIATVHNVYEGPWPRLLAYRLTDRWGTHTVAVTLEAGRRYVRLGATPSRRLSIVHNGIDTELFRPDPERRRAMRAERAAGEDFIWLSAGRLTRAKDIPNLLHAFAAVVQAAPRARLWIAGSGEPNYVKRLKNLAHALEIDKKVEWLGVRRDLAALYDAADGFVLSSAWEGMPLVVGEAMAMEKPVVATDVGGVFELVSRLGRVVNAKDAPMLASRMVGIMQMPEAERGALGREARERIEEKFGFRTRIEAWEKLYDEYVGQGA